MDQIAWWVKFFKQPKLEPTRLYIYKNIYIFIFRYFIYLISKFFFNKIYELKLTRQIQPTDAIIHNIW